MAFYVVSHKVNDFSTWKKIYDAFESTREHYGVKEHFALQSEQDPNHVMVIGEGELEAIQAFLSSDDLRSGMQDAGVASSPEIFIGEDKRSKR